MCELQVILRETARNEDHHPVNIEIENIWWGECNISKFLYSLLAYVRAMHVLFQIMNSLYLSGNEHTCCILWEEVDES